MSILHGRYVFDIRSFGMNLRDKLNEGFQKLAEEEEEEGTGVPTEEEVIKFFAESK